MYACVAHYSVAHSLCCSLFIQQLIVNAQAMASFVPEWARSHTGDHGDHSAMDHDAATTASPAHGTDANQQHDMGGDSNVEEAHVGHDMGESSSSSMQTMDPEFDMGADMNEAVELANGKRLLRGRRLSDDDHGMSHQDDSITDHERVEHMDNLKPYDDGGCVGINEVHKDMLPSSWGGKSSTHVHPNRPINEGIYTMDGLR